MIIRHKHKGRFTVVPNAIFNDDRLSLAAKGLVGYLLSRPGNWQVRHDQLQHKLGIGRKLLNKLLIELEEAGYLEREGEQGRDEYNRFMPYNYIVRDIPELATVASGAPTAPRPSRSATSTPVIRKKKSKLILLNLSPNPFPPSKLTSEGLAGKYSELGNGHGGWKLPVFVGSEPHRAWCKFAAATACRGLSIGRLIGGKPREIVWMPRSIRQARAKSGGQGTLDG